MHDGFVKFAAGTPMLYLADPARNAESVLSLVWEAEKEGAAVLVLPELCLTGATCGDLFLQSILLSAAETALRRICDETKDTELLIFLGLPVRIASAVYNCVAAIRQGRILGVTSKTHLHTASERCFASADSDGASRVISLAGQETVFGTNLVYCHDSVASLRISAEVGSDAFAAMSPSAVSCQCYGATVIVNCAALPEKAGEAARRRDALCSVSRRCICGYVLACAGMGESSTDEVYSGHSLILEAGEILCERKPFAKGNLIYSEIDVQSLDVERLQSGMIPSVTDGAHEIHFDTTVVKTSLTRQISRDPFLSGTGLAPHAAAQEILAIQAHGLVRRLAHTGAKCAVIGISGGLDSTLALLASVQAFDLMERPRREIICVTMPCFGTSSRTRDNAVVLCNALGCELRCIPITDAVLQHFRDIGHDPEKIDVTYENAQARERTQILMDIANREGGIVIGTGDLSELALGFATYNGDHMSMYGLNATVPKTMIRHVVSAYADDCTDPELAQVLRDILATPVSPELLPPSNGGISQRTEEILGDYILQDFFIYYTLRFGFAPKKILRMAKRAFFGEYTDAVIVEKLRLFYRRFFTQQFKRSCLPDGPATGEISFSPRGAFSMPSDAAAALWLSELESM